jgi:hypothetical protein
MALGVDYARALWDAANRLQLNIHEQLSSAKLPEVDVEDYAAKRLRQLSKLSQEMGDMHAELFRLVREAI